MVLLGRKQSALIKVQLSPDLAAEYQQLLRLATLITLDSKQDHRMRCQKLLAHLSGFSVVGQAMEQDASLSSVGNPGLGIIQWLQTAASQDVSRCFCP
jgi:hypothetical protein